MRLRGAVLALTCVVACVVVEPENEPATQETAFWSTGQGDSGSGSGSVSASSSGTDPSTGTSGDAQGDEDNGSTGFVNNDASAACGGSCDIWDPSDCPNGQKCTVVSCELGSSTWDWNSCREIMGWSAVGDPCEVFGDPLDGVDSCELGAVCWGVDPETELGVCIQFCQGNPSAPTCPAQHTCTQFADGVFPHCTASCDPLLQDCDNNDLCLPDFNDSGFVCVLDASGGMASYGTPCEFANVCNVGLICVAADAVPEPACETATGCCSPLCDINLPNTCPGVGQVCESLYEPGNEAPGYSHVGVCAVPG